MSVGGSDVTVVMVMVPAEMPSFICMKYSSRAASDCHYEHCPNRFLCIVRTALAKESAEPNFNRCTASGTWGARSICRQPRVHSRETMETQRAT